LKPSGKPASANKAFAAAGSKSYQLSPVQPFEIEHGVKCDATSEPNGK